jgi:hypothetical protein
MKLKYILKYDGKSQGKGVLVTDQIGTATNEILSALANSPAGTEITISLFDEDDFATQFIGLTTERAEDKAEELGLKLRNWSQISAGTMDLRADRINIWTHDDIVVKANIG